jgi:hypothetical protein
VQALSVNNPASMGSPKRSMAVLSVGAKTNQEAFGGYGSVALARMSCPRDSALINYPLFRNRSKRISDHR